MKKFFISYLLLFFVSTYFSNEYENLIENLRRKYNTNTYEAKISQRNYFSDIEIELISSANFYLMNNICVIEYYEPVYQFIKISEFSMITYMEEQNIVYFTRNSDIINESNKFNFYNLLNSNISFSHQENDFLVFKLNTNVKNQNCLEIKIDPINLSIHSITYKDQNGDQTIITIEHEFFNLPLSKNIESFKIPENAVIIE